MDLLNHTDLTVRPFYSHKLKPEEAPEAYLGLRDKPEEYIGVIFDWT